MPWEHRLRSGRTLWHELVDRYGRGVSKVQAMRRSWSALAPLIDPERHKQTADFLAIQEQEARWWRDASIAYFQHVSGRALPAGYAPPAHDLEWYKARRFRNVPGDPANGG